MRKLLSTFARQLTLLTALGLLIAACGADVATPTNPSSPSETASTLPPGGPNQLNAGSYALADFPVGISFEIPAFEPPAAWFGCSSSTVEQAVCYSPDEDIAPAAVTFQIVENVRTPPCSEQETAELLDPPVGPSVEDLVTAISNLEGYEATAAEDITVSGFSGKEFTLTAQAHGCGATWSTTERVTGMGAGEVNLLRILDVDGVRVMMALAYHPQETPADAVDAAEQVMDSVGIES